MNDVKERVVGIISRILKLNDHDKGILAQDSGQERLASWTSAHHAEIIVALEDEFGVEVGGKDILRLNSVPKIVDYFQNKKQA